MDTNFLLDIMFERRKRHGLVMKFMERFPYGSFYYTPYNKLELDKFIDEVAKSCNELLRNAIETASVTWEELDFSKKSDLINQIFQKLNLSPDKETHDIKFGSLIATMCPELFPNILALSAEEIMYGIESIIRILRNTIRDRLMMFKLITYPYQLIDDAHDYEYQIFSEILKLKNNDGNPLFNTKRDDDVIDTHNIAMLLTFFKFSPARVSQCQKLMINFFTFDEKLIKNFNYIKLNPPEILQYYLDYLNILQPSIQE